MDSNKCLKLENIDCFTEFSIVETLCSLRPSTLCICLTLDNILDKLLQN